MQAALRFEHVSKRYRIGLGKSGLREALAGVYKPRPQRENGDPNLLWALRDISFEVQKGEALGIIGANGAGKTTTLKLLSRVARPTEGKITLEGRVSSLIELGAGFHPDLTGRENIFLNGAIMGLRRQEIKAQFDNIVGFAELERFIDTPVKRYSSGMYARLGFAVAAHVYPDILLVDEVLSVGDEAFQIKCRDYIHQFVNSGRTSVFVSHNLYAIDQLCQRLIWLDKGQVRATGKAAQVLKMYLDENDRKLASAAGRGEMETDRIQINQLEVLDKDGFPRETFMPGDDVVIRLTYRQTGEIGRPYFLIWISEASAQLPLFAANMLLDDYQAPDGADLATITCRFSQPPLMPRAYKVWVEAYGADRSKLLYSWRVLGGFRVAEEEGGEAILGSVRFRRAHGVFHVPYQWGK